MKRFYVLIIVLVAGTFLDIGAQTVAVKTNLLYDANTTMK